MDEEKKVQETSKTDENIYAIFSYLSVLCLIPILMKKDDEFVKFHSRQGLMLFTVEIGFMIINIIPVLGQLLNLFGMLACGIISIIGIVQVLQGNKWKIPVIGDWAEKIKI